MGRPGSLTTAGLGRLLPLRPQPPPFGPGASSCKAPTRGPERRCGPRRGLRGPEERGHSLPWFITAGHGTLYSALFGLSSRPWPQQRPAVEVQLGGFDAGPTAPRNAGRGHRASRVPGKKGHGSSGQAGGRRGVWAALSSCQATSFRDGFWVRHLP